MSVSGGAWPFTRAMALSTARAAMRAVARQQPSPGVGAVAKLSRGLQDALARVGAGLAGHAADDQRHERARDAGAGGDMLEGWTSGGSRHGGPDHTRPGQRGAGDTESCRTRRSPAVSAVRAQIQAGALGKPLHFNGHYWCDYGSDPRAPISWRVGALDGSGGCRRWRLGLRWRCEPHVDAYLAKLVARQSHDEAHAARALNR